MLQVRFLLVGISLLMDFAAKSESYLILLEIRQMGSAAAIQQDLGGAQLLMKDRGLCTVQEVETSHHVPQHGHNHLIVQHHLLATKQAFVLLYSITCSQRMHNYQVGIVTLFLSRMCLQCIHSDQAVSYNFDALHHLLAADVLCKHAVLHHLLAANAE